MQANWRRSLCAERCITIDPAMPACEVILRVGAPRADSCASHHGDAPPGRNGRKAAWKMRVRPGDKRVPQQQPRTLMQMHDALVCIRPGRDAPLEQWQVYYHRSALLYAEIAEIDRSQSEKERASHDR